ncbi:MAG: hypothetical protein FWF81_05025 [Defluviitaleaceae bacterium]|nr:hypothetical protein [Defluviitaleaceae bacterium]
MNRQMKNRNFGYGIRPTKGKFGEIIIPSPFLSNAGIKGDTSVWVILDNSSIILHPAIILKNDHKGYEHCQKRECKISKKGKIRLPQEYLRVLGVTRKDTFSYLSIFFPLRESAEEVLLEGGSLNNFVFRRYIRDVAKEKGMSADELCRNIEIVIDEAQRTPTHKIKAILDNIPHDREKPTPEEYFAHVSAVVDCADMENYLFAT